MRRRSCFAAQTTNCDQEQIYDYAYTIADARHESVKASRSRHYVEISDVNLRKSAGLLNLKGKLIQKGLVKSDVFTVAMGDSEMFYHADFSIGTIYSQAEVTINHPEHYENVIELVVHALNEALLRTGTAA